MKCTKCGKENAEGAVYCRNCGAKLDAGDFKLVEAEHAEIVEIEERPDLSGTGI